MQEKSDVLKTPVRFLKGVGPKKSELLSRIGISTVLDMLYYLPSRYEDRSTLTRIKDLKPGHAQTIEGDVFSVSNRLSKSGLPVFQVAITDGTGLIHAVWFNQPYLRDYFKKGDKVVLYGRVERYDRLQIVQPEYEFAKDESGDKIHMGRIVPIYPSTTDLSQRYLRSLLYQAVTKYFKSMTETLPTNIIARQHIVDIRFAVMNIHFPASFDNLEKAYRRIVFEEFFLLQLALAMKRGEAKSGQKAPGHVAGGELVDAFRRSLKFELTGAQKKAIGDIERDMTSGKPMNRLLEGDVGSGKTVVAAWALALTVQNGYQGAIMAPTEVLARQHFVVLSELFMPLGVNVALLIGGVDEDKRREICGDIRDGEVDIVVGTHAVIQGSVEFKNLGLAVIDEQHKFGVSQRAAIKSKGANPHILVMTATPIPRTLAMTVYGDLDMSVIKELPKGRKPVVTYWVEEAKRREVYNFVKEEVEKGRQAYIVCPVIDSKEDGRAGVAILPDGALSGVKAAKDLFKKLADGPLGQFEIALLHGKMTVSEKDKVMRDFKKGRVQILVSTVVIEVGIDVANATVMLVESADRFGLAQLHQLRGRVGRGERESFCILLADPKTEEAAKRLETVQGTADGFEIAEVDLALRGPGEFFGARQHGLPEIRFGNILKDFEIMEAARREAFGVVEKDPRLLEDHHKLLRAEIRERFKERLGLVGVA